MNIKAFFALLCGVGIFLFSVVQMSESMKAVFESRTGTVLQRYASNRFFGVIAGALSTAVVQSSAAVTVTAVSLADCGVLSLSQCVGVIMGSNIGTTFTSVLTVLNFSAAAPFLILFGAFCALAAKKKSIKSTAVFFCALGLLFVGLDTMRDASRALDENGFLSSLFLRFSSKLASVFIGFASTAVMQSSSATVGVLQSLVFVGAISRESAIFMICGQNIGATVPTLISALRAGKTAKAAAVFHLIFNLFGAAAFLLLSLFVPLPAALEEIEDGKVFVCTVHVLFNLLCTAALFPFAERLAKFSLKLIEGKKEKPLAKSHK